MAAPYFISQSPFFKTFKAVLGFIENTELNILLLRMFLILEINGPLKDFHKLTSGGVGLMNL